MALQQSVAADAEIVAAQRAVEAEVFMAAETFGAALRASPEFAALLHAADLLRADTDANAAIDAFSRRQAELRMQMMFGTIAETEAADLKRLQEAMLACPSVASYVAAQDAFGVVCRETAGVISGQIEIDFAANSRSGGCCG